VDAIPTGSRRWDGVRIAANTTINRRPTSRELDVVRLVIEGKTNDEIGAALGIGAKTVETHLHRLSERFDVASRTELATRALREGWLEIPSDA
jgi:DNA-binding NarL/FixJ family response regulator